ncbi:MAG: T9SS type A sorting domain-containing protein [Flavobacteriales bacterium]
MIKIPTTKSVGCIRLFVLACVLLSSQFCFSQEESVAMRWSEVQLSCIRKDAARPTVQARNLYHSAIIMYDAWAAYDDDANTVFLGKTLGDFYCPFDGVMLNEDVQAAQEKALSYAMYRFLTDRYQPFAPTPSGAPANNWVTFMSGYVNGLMTELGYDPSITSTDYSDGDPAKFGNYLAMRMQEYGLQDGSNQQNNYANLYYQTVNGNLFMEQPGNPLQYDGNRWQPLSLTTSLDQNGLPVANGSPALSAEWGRVTPFSLTEDQYQIFQRDGYDWKVYLDQGAPPMLDTTSAVERQWDEDFFRWGFAVVAIWHSFHDTADGVLKDISPNSIGNVDTDAFPVTFEEYKAFYNEFEGGEIGTGYDINPITGSPYAEQIVPRADYSRVLSEYWADGPNSETPPGHWFKNINSIITHPLFERRWEGQGDLIDALEFDVRSYLALGGAIHDVAVACWGEKGYYDSTRPVMAIRYMIDHGQCSDINAPNYDPAGIPLVPGYIEVVQEGDELAGANNENVGKVKLYTFRGPVAATGMDGVGWILGERWWTFQRRTFVTPPFPGYYSGHSTYSRAAAEVLTRITGSEYYPGGLGEFVANPGYLAASSGPSQTISLQWAKYADAADQCSLSRIYGGLHPPQDDIPGRRVGRIIGPQAFDYASSFMHGTPHITALTSNLDVINDAEVGNTLTVTANFSLMMDMNSIPTLVFPNVDLSSALSYVGGEWLNSTTYQFNYTINDSNEEFANVVGKVEDALNVDGVEVIPANAVLFDLDTQNPSVLNAEFANNIIADLTTALGQTNFTINFDEEMNTAVIPTITLNGTGIAGVVFNESLSSWNSTTEFNAVFDLSDANVTALDATVDVVNAQDILGNTQDVFSATDMLDVDTENPMVSTFNTSGALVNASMIGGQFTIQAVYSENMDNAIDAQITFAGGSIANTLALSSEGWLNENTYQWIYDVLSSVEEVTFITSQINISAKDLFGNNQVAYTNSNPFDIDTQVPAVTLFSTSDNLLLDADVASEAVSFTVEFDDQMNESIMPEFTFSEDVAGDLVLNTTASSWNDDQSFTAVFDLVDFDSEIFDVQTAVISAYDLGGNNISEEVNLEMLLDIDTFEPTVLYVVPSASAITVSDIGTATFYLDIVYNQPMASTSTPVVTFPIEDVAGAISYNGGASSWINETTFRAVYNVNDVDVYAQNVDVTVESATDPSTNIQNGSPNANKFSILLTTGVDEFGVIETSSIYPNPVKSGMDLTITMTEIPADLTIAVLDIQGKLISNLPIRNQLGNQVVVSTEGIAAGNYFVVLHSKKESASFQITVTQ